MRFSIQALAFERNDKMLFSEINFVLSGGEFLQVRGNNGSGKSTLLRLLAGFLEPAAGKILWNDHCIFAEREEFLSQIHYVGHKNSVKLNLTVSENLCLNAALMRKEIELTEIQAVLKKIGLSKAVNTLTVNLSAGQLRRLTLARLWLNSSKLWLLDEPSTALDNEGQALLTQMLNQHLDAGGIAVVATHHNLLKRSGMNMKELWLGEKCE